jgi:hypothetical protein
MRVAKQEVIHRISRIIYHAHPHKLSQGIEWGKQSKLFQKSGEQATINLIT